MKFGIKSGFYALAGALLVFISGCTTLGPDYVAPEVDTELQWLQSQDPVLSSQEPANPEWWSSAFKDPVLNELIDISLNDNLSLRSAGLRVLQARENLRIAVGQRYPTQTLDGAIGRDGLAENGLAPGQDQYFNSDELGFNLQWEADVWGRFRRLAQSASADLDASVASYDGILLSLLSQVSNTYLTLRSVEERITFLEENVRLEQESLDIAIAKFEGGLVTELDPDQARSLLYNSKAELSALQITRGQLRNTLALLLGRKPGEVNEILGGSGKVPLGEADVALGMPQDLIRRRPDIRQAERQLASQSALIGFAIADLYPSFSLGGSVRFASNDADDNDLDDIFNSDSRSWDFNGGFNWNIWNYGRVKGNIRLQDAVFQQLAIDYENTVLNAQTEIENAIIGYLISREQLDWYQQAADAAQNSVNVAQIQYNEGLTDFNTLVTVLEALQEQQDLLAATKGTVATNLVEVYRALGGGWEIRSSRRAEDLIPEATKEEMRQRIKYWDGELE
ncbi:MAG: efflux transporter outer membrane subunit [Gammaproteobacteria bacterium]